MIRFNMSSNNPMNSAIDRRHFLKSNFAAAGSAIASSGLGMAAPFAAAAPQQAKSASPRNDTTVNDNIVASMQQAELSMLFRGKSAEECREWQKAFRAQLNDLLGGSRPPEKWTVVEEGRTELADHTRYELLLAAKGVPSLPVYLLIPQSASRQNRMPAVLCIHGHGPYGNHPIVGRRDLEGVAENIAKNNYDYGLQFVRRGYVVAAPCMIPFGRRVNAKAYGGNDPCAVTFVRMQAHGRLPITANLRDLRWSLDLLQSREEVLSDRLGCAGLSYGGRMTMMASAMDDRIKVAAVSGALNLLQERMTLRYSCGSQVIPGLLKYGDYSEIGSLIAPRPCVWETGSKDPLIVSPWDEVFRNRLTKAYRALGAADKLKFDRFEGGHVWSGKIAFPLFDSVLKG